MIYNRIVAFLLFTFSFVVISLVGFQCSTNWGLFGPGVSVDPNTGNQTINTGELTSNFDDVSSNSSSSLTNEDIDDYGANCNAALINNYRDTRSPGAIANIKYHNTGVLNDLGEGASASGAHCGKMFLSLSKSGNTYGGTVTFTYQRNTVSGGQLSKSITARNFETDSHLNGWRRGGRFPEADGEQQTSFNTFHAIFEGLRTTLQSKPPVMGAVILHIINVKRVHVSDTDVRFLGAGNVFYKMFKTYNPDKEDPCYNQGRYVRLAGDPINRPAEKCWNISSAVLEKPYGCRPQGLDVAPDIRVGATFNCYKALGKFAGLDIEKAFGVTDIDELQ